MTLKEKLSTEFNCAIIAILGDNADKEIEECPISKEDLIAIANKVAFYMDL